MITNFEDKTISLNEYEIKLVPIMTKCLENEN